ncbi:hypothetical protein SAMN04488056_10654 [Cohaesibacter marisflavi]|uniref:UPF0276 protein SAMN04488056_10654 n=1 Tax=Cohaesibacter marisflavi TaxID=655353 RepID=A0A1I5H6G3_9HYPH|nr:DUF692 domain-containing protein [Cohaesibacter marisflavi]SFO43807.1 hypothetical protein SAMN04488056_10654 [Cohaesibacter marisflavi]
MPISQITPASSGTTPKEIPPRAGVGLKAEHYQTILETAPDIGWFEVHPENYMGAGGPPHRYLSEIAARYPLSLHGVGASIGADKSLDTDHINRLKALNERYAPGLFSEHLAWSSHDEVFFNDLLPVPYRQDSLDRVVDHVNQLQDHLSRRILIENPSVYVAFESSTMSEITFLERLVARTGCGLLLDCNNVYVSATNQNYDPVAYLDAFPVEHVGEIHLAGFARDEDDEGEPLLIDAHDREVADAVWALYDQTLARSGAVPTLIEWDNNIPDWDILFAEAMRAEDKLRALPTRLKEPEPDLILGHRHVS